MLGLFIANAWTLSMFITGAQRRKTEKSCARLMLWTKTGQQTQFTKYASADAIGKCANEMKKDLQHTLKV